MCKIFANSPELFKWIIDEYPDTIKLVSADFLSFLIKRCYDDIVERLVDGGVEINTSGDSGVDSPLLTALIYNKKAVLFLLKRENLDLDIRRVGNCSAALSRVCYNFSTTDFELALKNASVGRSSQDYNGSLEYICMLGCIDKLKLVFSCSNVHVPTSALFIAMKSACCKKFIQTLIDHPSVDINAQEKSRETPFVAACRLNLRDIALIISNHPRFDPDLICLGKRQIDHSRRWNNFRGIQCIRFSN